MSSGKDPIFPHRSHRPRGLIICGAVTMCLFSCGGTATAQVGPPSEITEGGQPTTATQTPPTTASVPISAQTQATAVIQPTTQGPFEPPTASPEETPLPSGAGKPSIGQWLLSPTVDSYALYDTNVYSSPTNALSGPGLHFHPSILAERNTGIFDTQIYGNIDSTVYPTLDYQNNTFNKQAGMIQSYSPLRDLVFTAQGDYTHNTLANILTNSIPSPVISSATPVPLGAAGVVASPQVVVNPNDTFTGTASIYKEFNRAYIKVGATDLHTDYTSTPLQDFDQQSYFGNGAFWLTPQLYAYADGIQAFTEAETGVNSTSFRARGGFGTAQIALLQASVYYGGQGTQVQNDGSAGGDIYGGVLTYVPTQPWNMSVSVDRLRNISNITTALPQGLGGLPLTGVAVSVTQSSQLTTVAFKSNYNFSPQTTIYGVVSDTQIEYLGTSRVDTSWLASVGIRHQLRHDLALTLDYQYTSLASPQPLTSFNRNLVMLGAHYNY
jgi:hypothetical protein